jgi:hypothetical protein
MFHLSTTYISIGIYYLIKTIKLNDKICIIEVYILTYYFESHLIYKWCYYRKTIFNQLKIMVSYVDINGLCHNVPIIWEIYVMRPKCHMWWLRFNLKRMLVNRLWLNGELVVCQILKIPFLWKVTTNWSTAWLIFWSLYYYYLWIKILIFIKM